MLPAIIQQALYESRQSNVATEGQSNLQSMLSESGGSTSIMKNFFDGSKSGMTLPEKIDTRTVVEMIKNADLYDLISISLRANELKEEQVELFI
jgi:hypothetical protein